MTAVIDDVRPTVLLVEDNPTILEQREEVFKNNGFDTVVAKSLPAALSKFRSTPGISILATDINLDDDDAGNQDGLKLAEELHSIMPSLPMVALSGKVSEQTFRKSKRASLFKEFVVKGKGLEHLEARVPEWREWAVNYLATRITTREEEVARLKAKYKISDYDFELMREFIPLPLESGADLDAMLASKGYRLQIIETFGLPPECVREGIKTVKSIAMWVRQDQDFYVAEVYGFPLLYAFGETEEEAIQQTLSLMHGFFQDLEASGRNEMDSDLVRNMQQYLTSVFSSD